MEMPHVTRWVMGLIVLALFIGFVIFLANR